MHKNSYRKKNGFFFLISVVVLPLLFSCQAIAADSDIEYKIKAAYLFNFTKFISWPENDSKTFNLCILGKDPFGSIIDPIEKRTVKNKAIRLYRLRSVKKVKHCHIIYMGQKLSKWKRARLKLPSVLTISSQKQTLMVGESRHFLHSGGMISFFQKQGKVKLLINLVALKKSGLEVSAKLLEVAEIYAGESND